MFADDEAPRFEGIASVSGMPSGTIAMLRLAGGYQVEAQFKWGKLGDGTKVLTWWPLSGAEPIGLDEPVAWYLVRAEAGFGDENVKLPMHTIRNGKVYQIRGRG